MSNPIFNFHRNLFSATLNPTFIALFFGGAVLLRGLVLLALAGANWTSDSQSFVLFGHLLRDFSVSMPLYLRAPPYLIINAITFSDLYLTPILIFHALLAGFAAGFLVYAIATSNKFVAVLIGIVLLCDMVWATSQRIILIEGPLASFQLIAIALLVLHYGKSPRSLTILFCSGVIYGWCLLFRQSNLPLLLPILFFYAYRLRSFRHVAAVGVGMLALLMAMTSLNYLRTGEGRLWAQGGWYAEFPMFDLGMFSPQNGTASQRIAEDIANCGITKEPDKLRFLAKGETNVTQWIFESCILRQESVRIADRGGSSPSDVRASGFSNKCKGESGAPIAVEGYHENWYQKIKCAYAEKDWAFEDRVALLIATAYYKEALPRNLHLVPEILWREVPHFLAGRTYTLPSQLWLLPLWTKGTPDYICPFDWCTRQNFSSSYPFDTTLILNAQELAKWSTQFYLALSDDIFLGENTDDKTFGVFLALSLIILTAPSGVVRVLGAVVIMAIFYNAVITTLVNVYILRYTSTMSSLYAIHSGLAVCALILFARTFFDRVRKAVMQ